MKERKVYLFHLSKANNVIVFFHARKFLSVLLCGIMDLVIFKICFLNALLCKLNIIHTGLPALRLVESPADGEFLPILVPCSQSDSLGGLSDTFVHILTCLECSLHQPTENWFTCRVWSAEDLQAWYIKATVKTGLTFTARPSKGDGPCNEGKGELRFITVDGAPMPDTSDSKTLRPSFSLYTGVKARTALTDFIQHYCNMGERPNSAALRQKVEEVCEHWGQLVDRYWWTLKGRLIYEMCWAHWVIPEFANVLLCY